MADPLLFFGGTFDPPHRGHAELPPLVAEALGCPRILYVPAAINPLKQEDTPPTPGADRLAMLKLAIAGHAASDISTIELDRPGPSYTVDTLETVCADHDGPVYLLMGSDQAMQFKRWHAWERILELARPAVIIRPPLRLESYRTELTSVYNADEVERWWRWQVEVPAIDLCATDVRARLAAGEPVDDALAPTVVRYIHEHGLYGVGS